MTEPTRTVYPLEDKGDVPGGIQADVPAGRGADATVRGKPDEPGGTVAAAGKTLVERTGGWSLLLATVVFFLNMGGAWWTITVSNRLVAQALVGDSPTTVSRALETVSGADANTHVLLNRLVDAELMLRTFQNHQTLAVVAMSTAFALVAVGFALFVMGAEGAFKVEGSVADRGNVVIKSTAPGLLCFVLAAGLVCYAMYAIAPVVEGGKFEVYPDREGTTSAATPSPEAVARDGPPIPALEGSEIP